MLILTNFQVKPIFFAFDSIEILNIAKTVNDTLLNKWIKLCNEFYKE